MNDSHEDFINTAGSDTCEETHSHQEQLWMKTGPGVHVVFTEVLEKLQQALRWPWGSKCNHIKQNTKFEKQKISEEMLLCLDHLFSLSLLPTDQLILTYESFQTKVFKIRRSPTTSSHILNCIFKLNTPYSISAAWGHLMNTIQTKEVVWWCSEEA